MTQAQQALIVTFLTQQCELIETVFIDEMRDHFVASVEARMADSFSFEEALQQTIDDFGGPTTIQKMEWTYRKVYLRSLLRNWWTLIKSQFAAHKRIRTLLVVGFVTFASLYFGLMSDFMAVLGETILWNSVQWVSIIWVIMLSCFLLQRVAPGLKQVGVVRFPALLIRLLTYLLWAGTVLLYVSLSSMELSLLIKGVSYFALWSTSALFYLGLVDFSKQTDPNSWYSTK
ncbi:hypothetical protein GCM10028806_38090 [Spirosoma terrae]|uniref:Uncharacterized protein n=1 Tax=Spirosoma terrae TaxID=1968276 RepID=A0A6L9LF23_9BACT|nr:hypothetical protein [Spirosoma terrae]NDU97741.1 hypothetical protein [Spirosoma terrae]